MCVADCEESEEQRLCVKVWWLKHWFRDYLDTSGKCPVDIHIFADGEEIRMWKSNACVDRVATGKTKRPMWKWGIPELLKKGELRKRAFTEVKDEDETEEEEDERGEGKAAKRLKIS